MDDLNMSTDDSLPQGEPITADSTPPPDTGQQQQDGSTGSPSAKGGERFDELSDQKDTPEAYALDLGAFAEGMPPEELEFYGHMARDAGATPEVASALMQRLGIYHQATQDFTAKEWAEAARNDQEYGGAQFEENIAFAKQALDQFATPEFKELLAHSPMGNHPEVIRFLYRVSRAVSADGVVRGGGVPAQSVFDARDFYPNSNMNP